MTAIVRNIIFPHRHGPSPHRRRELSEPWSSHYLCSTTQLSTPPQVEPSLHHSSLRSIGCFLFNRTSVRFRRRVKPKLVGEDRVGYANRRIGVTTGDEHSLYDLNGRLLEESSA